MQLYVGEFDGSNATAMIRWCLSPKEIARLKKMPAIPKIVISVVKVNDDNVVTAEESRIIRPLTDMATYVSFRNPGQHMILAGILDQDRICERGLLRLHSKFSGYSNYRYNILDEIINKETHTFTPCINSEYIQNNTEQANLTLDVDEKLFATKPRDYQFVNCWFDTKPIDECHNRRRRIEAYFLTLTVGPLLYLFRLIWCVLFQTIILGNIYVNWKWFVSPFTISFKKPEEECYNAWAQNSDRKLKSFWRVLINWRSIIVLSFFGFLLIRVIISAPAMFFAGIIMSVIIMATIFGITLLSGPFAKWMVKRGELSRQAEAQRMREEFKTLSCKLVPKEVSLNSLPESKKTIRLRFNHLKNKLCRPFAGN